jgi:hypothetical protein
MLLSALRVACLAVTGLLVLPSCLFANVTAPLAYRSPTPADVGGVGHLGAVTEGHACSHLVLGLVAWGDGGFAAAMQHATDHAAMLASPSVGSSAGTASASPMGAALLADVQADSSALNVLGIYQRRCTIIHAKVVQ